MRSRLSISRGFVYLLYHSDLTESLTQYIFRLSEQDKTPLLSAAADKNRLTDLKRIIDLVFLEFDKKDEMYCLNELTTDNSDKSLLSDILEILYNHLEQIADIIPTATRENFLLSTVDNLRTEIKRALNRSDEFNFVMTSIRRNFKSAE